jgi:hypothetical protein
LCLPRGEGPGTFIRDTCPSNCDKDPDEEDARRHDTRCSLDKAGEPVKTCQDQKGARQHHRLYCEEEPPPDVPTSPWSSHESRWWHTTEATHEFRFAIASRHVIERHGGRPARRSPSRGRTHRGPQAGSVLRKRTISKWDGGDPMLAQRAGFADPVLESLASCSSAQSRSMREGWAISQVQRVDPSTA